MHRPVARNREGKAVGLGSYRHTVPGQRHGLDDRADVRVVGRRGEHDLEAREPALGCEHLDLETLDAGARRGQLDRDLEVAVGDLDRAADRVVDLGRVVDVGGIEGEQPRAHRQDDDAERRLGAECTPEPIGHRHGHLGGAGETMVDELTRRQGDEQHRRDDDDLEHEDATVGRSEQRPPVESDHLDDPAGDGRDDRDGGDPPEAAHGVDEVLLAGADEHDACEEDHAADPDRHRQRVCDAHRDAEDRHGTAGAAEPDRDDRQRRDAERGHLRCRDDHAVGPERDPGSADDEQQSGERGACRRARVEEIDPVARVEPDADRLLIHRGRRRRDVENRADEGNDPGTSYEADRDEVLDTLRPRRRDQDECTEHRGDPEHRQESPQPQRPLAGIDLRQQDDIVGRSGDVDRSVAGFDDDRGGRRCVVDAGRGRVRLGLDVEGDVARTVRCAIGVAHPPPGDAGALRKDVDDRGGERAVIVADLRTAQCEELGVAVECDRVRLAEFLEERDDDRVRRGRDRCAVGRIRADDRVLGPRDRWREREQRDGREQGRANRGGDSPTDRGNTCAFVHSRTEASQRRPRGR